MIYVFILLTLLLSAFFSSSEIAFLSADRLKVELDKAKGKLIPQIQDFFYNRSGKYITTILVGNNIVNVIYGMLVAKVLEKPLRTLLGGEDLIIVLVQTLVSTAIIIVLGEYCPKALAKMSPNAQLRFSSIPLFFLYWLLLPITLIASGVTAILLRVFGVKNTDNGVVPLSKIDLDYYIEANATPEETVASEARLLQNALEFSDLKVRDCLIPRNEIAAIEEKDDIGELIQLFDRTGFSKILVYRDTIDDIIGYIHSIEMFKCHQDGTDWRSHIKQTIYIPESLPVEKAMKKLLQKKRNIAIVVDELGGTAGIVTLEDVVEEIFGEIEDEHDNNKVIMRKDNDDEYLISGRAEVDILNETFDLHIPESDEYKTLAGYILNTYQGIPERGAVITLSHGFKAKILRATENKITLVRLFKTPANAK